jgi:hypothetical protein
VPGMKHKENLTRRYEDAKGVAASARSATTAFEARLRRAVERVLRTFVSSCEKFFFAPWRLGVKQLCIATAPDGGGKP